jgi:periplasmic protein TonB
MMKRNCVLVILGALLWLTNESQAQTNDLAPKDSIYSKVDVLPEFPGGRKALGKYVDGANHHYPKEASANKIEGKVVIQFIIDQEGMPGEFKVVQGIGYGCDEAAVEAFKKMPKWKPALVNGKPVKFRTQMGYLYKL